jgi:hypothetical protein
MYLKIIKTELYKQAETFNNVTERCGLPQHNLGRSTEIFYCEWM